MMSQRQATLQRLCMSTYDKLYNDAQVHEDRLQTKRQQLGCSSDPDVSYIQRVGSVDSGKLRPTLSSTFSLDTANPRMAAGDRLYAYHLKKQVCPHLTSKPVTLSLSFRVCDHIFCASARAN